MATARFAIQTVGFTMPMQLTLLDDRQWPSTGFHFELPVCPDSTALGIIDVQRYAIDPSGHLALTIRTHDAGLFQEYQDGLGVMVRNIRKLLKAFRGGKRRVFYTRHGVQLPDGADLIVRRRGREDFARTTRSRRGHMALRGEAAYEIISEVAPRRTELILDKNTSSAFHSTPLDLFLRNMKIETLVLAGLASDQCVLATAIDAADRGFHVIIAADACAGLDAGSARAVQILFGRVWGYVMQTSDIVAWLKTAALPKQTRLSDGLREDS